MVIDEDTWQKVGIFKITLKKIKSDNLNPLHPEFFFS